MEHFTGWIILRKLIIAILTAAAALCAAGCGDIKENTGSADNTSSAAQTTAGLAPASDESAVPDENTGMILSIGYQPGGEMSLEDFERLSFCYNVYDTGVVKKAGTIL